MTRQLGIWLLCPITNRFVPSSPTRHSEKPSAALARTPTEFFRVTLPTDEATDRCKMRQSLWNWRPGACFRQSSIKTKKYPLLIYVYGEPAGTTVVNRWSSKSYLWHQLMAQQGYVVMSFDNRGTKSPRGREWRKSIYRKIGIIPPADQAAAAQGRLERSHLPRSLNALESGAGAAVVRPVYMPFSSIQTCTRQPLLSHQFRTSDTTTRSIKNATWALPDSNVEGFTEGSPINFAKQLEGNL